MRRVLDTRWIAASSAAIAEDPMSAILYFACDALSLMTNTSRVNDGDWTADKPR